MMKNKLYVAGAGSGKTALLVKEALKIKDKNVLITTYTEENEQSIKQKIIKWHSFIPANITIQTWFSFLIKNGIKPFQGVMNLSNFNCTGLNLVNNQSAPYIAENKTAVHYFNSEGKIYSDKIAKFTVNCNIRSKGKVIDRLSNIYQHIFIDEVQDLAGYDLDLLKLFFNSSISMILVLDPRQGTYSTNNSQKNKKFRGITIMKFFEKCNSLKINKNTLNTNHRCHPQICQFSNKLYPEYSEVLSNHEKVFDDEHVGIHFIKKADVNSYLEKYRPYQLRYDRSNKHINSNYPVMNFGQVKGLEFDRVVIFPTLDMLGMLKGSTTNLSDVTKAKLYVAITRAKLSLAIVED